jgi:probable rRNA maturation factor
MLELNVQNVVGQQPIDAAAWTKYFQTWITQPDLGLPPSEGYEITLRLTDDAEIRSLNAQYRQIDQPTDVLAFAALDESMVLSPALANLPIYLGDIIISMDTARKQSVEQGHPLSTELLWLASHGFLHLLGWDHPDDESLAQMLACQDRLLGTIVVSAATQAARDIQL